MRYRIKHALVQYDGETILEDVNFEIHDKEKIAVVGRNGCGKTTLLKLIVGDIHMNNLDSDEECGIEIDEFDTDEFLDVFCRASRALDVRGQLYDIDDEEYSFISEAGDSYYVNAKNIKSFNEDDDLKEEDEDYDD